MLKIVEVTLPDDTVEARPMKPTDSPWRWAIALKTSEGWYVVAWSKSPRKPYHTLNTTIQKFGTGYYEIVEAHPRNVQVVTS